MSSSSTADACEGAAELAAGPAPLSRRPTAGTLVVGLGNPILSDDGVGWRVVEAAAGQRALRADVEFDCFALGGIALMERLIGYRGAILVDAIQTRGGVPGRIYRLTLDDLPTLHADSVHDASLNAALELGRRLGAELPSDIVILAVEAANLYDFGETLTPAVAAAVPAAATALLAAIDELAPPAWLAPRC